MTEDRKPNRCAIYTRKSTEYNLDLLFNSLDAQREACEAYIKSQVHEGWRLLPDRYDDGGISGATLDRPDIQRLLAHVRAGNVDTVVVYKVDRLSRSLMDFAKLVELFDVHDVSFVSVTQSFNSTTSMGRLTLNVLLSFAQFEREVIGERVRDKVAASKRKGIWMGGQVPLGYINMDKKLFVVTEEAERVRWIFRRYLELGAIGPLLQELDRVGIPTKRRHLSSGRIVGVGRFGKGGLNHLLKNRSYIGEIEHRGEFYAACHEPILERSLFEAVQDKMAANNVTKRQKFKSPPFLLTGLIFDSAGNRMTPTHALKKGIRYRYYVSQAVLQGRKGEAGSVPRVPAPDVEAAIEAFLRDRAGPGYGAAIQGADARGVLEAHVARIGVQADTLEVKLSPAAHNAAPDGHLVRPADKETVSLPWGCKPLMPMEGKVVALSRVSEATPRSRDAILTAIGKARLWIDEIVGGGSFAEIASREGKCERQIRLLARLAFVPPFMVRELIEGATRRPTICALARSVPLLWATRERDWGLGPLDRRE
jgi:site-specific DNA recombinase